MTTIKQLILGQVNAVGPTSHKSLVGYIKDQHCGGQSDWEKECEVSASINDLIKEDFAYLHVGQWGKGGYGEDRKNISKSCGYYLRDFDIRQRSFHR